MTWIMVELHYTNKLYNLLYNLLPNLFVPGTATNELVVQQVGELLYNKLDGRCIGGSHKNVTIVYMDNFFNI
jgi:hypothetical protein